MERLREWAFAVVWLFSAPVEAQNPNAATETTQIMNFMQLLEVGYSVAANLQTARDTLQHLQSNAKQLKQGDIIGLRTLVSTARGVQHQAMGMLAAQQALAVTLAQHYPSPRSIGGRFNSWGEYRIHLRGVEQQTHDSMVETAEAMDTWLDQGLREDERLLSNLKAKADSAKSDTQRFDIMNQLLLELIRQMHMLRAEAMAGHRMQVLSEARAQQLRTARVEARDSLELKPSSVRPRSAFKSYRLGGSPSSYTPEGDREIVRPPGADVYVGPVTRAEGGREIMPPPGTVPYEGPTYRTDGGRHVVYPPGAGPVQQAHTTTENGRQVVPAPPPKNGQEP